MRRSSRWAKGFTIAADPPAVRRAPQVEDDHQRLFHRGQHRRDRGADALHRLLRPLHRRGPDPRLAPAQRGPTRACSNWSRSRPATTSTPKACVYSDDYSADQIAEIAQADRPAVLQPAACGRRGLQAPANHALATEGPGLADHSPLPHLAHRHPGRPQAAQVDRQTGQPASRLSSPRCQPWTHP